MRLLRAVLWLALAVLVTLVLSTPLGPLPALLPLLNPSQGVWSVAGDAASQPAGTVHVPGLQGPVSVVWSKGQVPHVFAKNDHDLFFMQGYLEASNRLFQMDAMRREGEGTLAAILGKPALQNDEQFLSYGLLVGAERTLRSMRQDPAGQAALGDLQAYSAGVNQVIRQDEQSHNLPLIMKLLGYSPKPWTPLDSLVVQEDMQENLSLNLTALDMAVLVQRFGPQLANALLPLMPPNAQHPYDPGPYGKPATAPLPPVAVGGRVSATAAALAGRILGSPSLFAGAFQGLEMSNNWVVGGQLTASGKPLLAGDPHLDLTLPSIWYELQLQDPHYDVAGVSIPGTPGILIGHNQQIAWSLTDTESQSTFFYVEHLNGKHPTKYLYDGTWHPLTFHRYTLQVKGGQTVRYSVPWTNNGPILTADGQTVAMDWTGQIASQDVTALLAVDQAQDWQQFKQALLPWNNPPHNFVFADRAGEIGIIAPGFYPVFPKGVRPWLPMNGTGGAEWIGRIPESAIPQSYNPPNHFLWSANQRPVAANYPYYIGTAWDWFSNGYRADTIYNFLANPKNQPFTVAKMEQLQSDNQDYLALHMAPLIAKAGKELGLTGSVGHAVASLASWPGVMSQDSVQAAIYYAFWQDYMQAVFGPWWRQAKVPVKKDPDLAISQGLTPLDEDLQVWTLDQRSSPWLMDPVTHQMRSTDALMRQALRQAIAGLTKTLGPNPTHWQWGREHKRLFASLSGLTALARGPYASSGDENTPDAADSGLVATAGPSWRMVVDLGDLSASRAIYPGGQSENPVSPDYASFLPYWLHYRYLPFVWAKSAATGRTTTYQP